MRIVKLVLVIICFNLSAGVFAQGIGINNTGALPVNSAMLDVLSTDKGILIPRMTTSQQLAINSPATGLLIFNTDSVNFWFFDGTLWRAICNCDIMSVPPKICPDSIVDGRDTQVYKTIEIGTQCWMAENLNIGSMVISDVSHQNQQQFDNSIYEKYCYDNDINNCDGTGGKTKLGGLYEGNEMMQYDTIEGIKGVCPTGWHVPTDAEWMIMEEYLGMCTGTTAGCSGATNDRGAAQFVGDKLRKPGIGICIGSTPPCGDSGFDGFYTGVRNPTMSGGTTFLQLNVMGYYWTSSPFNYFSSGAWRTRQFLNASAGFYRGSFFSEGGFSVRCLMD